MQSPRHVTGAMILHAIVGTIASSGDGPALRS